MDVISVVGGKIGDLGFGICYEIMWLQFLRFMIYGCKYMKQVEDK